MHRLNYHHLYLFWTLAQEGTFTRTSEKLLISQSAITAQIKQLEQLLDLELIDRSNRRKPTLTEEGKKVLEYAHSIFETGNELLKWAKGGNYSKNKTLKIGALSGLSRNFQYEFLSPFVRMENIKIEVITGDQEKLVRLLKEHSLDLILSSHNVSSDGRVRFYSHVLKTSPMLFVINAKEKKSSYNLRDYLKEKPLYMPGSSFEAKAELDAYLEKLKVNVNVHGEIDDTALLRVFALKSNAVVAVSELGIINEIKSKEIHVIEKSNKIAQRFYAITRQKKHPNNLIESIVGEIKT